MRILNNVGINQRRADSYFDIYLMCDAPYVAINFAQWAGGELAVQTIKWVLQWFRDKVYETTEKEESFEDVDPKFTAWIQKAAKFDPRKLKKTSE